MATISTSQTFDSAARTAGEAFTIQSGAVFTIDSHTRDGKNSAATRAGSISSFTMTGVTGGKVIIDSSKVKYIKYDGLQGTPNVPTIGAVLRGVTSGATGELMNISAGISTVPTAAGAAMPATGIILFKSITGTFQDNEIIEVQTGGLDLCTANGTIRTGWLEITMDDAASFTIGRAQEFVINNDDVVYWFESETTGSGSAQQQVQFPNYGGANFFLPGVWVDEAANDNWEFWPASLAGTGSPWATANLGTDARSKFCQCLGGGIIRFGGDGTNAIGKVPTSGAKFRIPNVLLKSAATASRASDSVPNGTLATRPDFTMTNAGSIRINGAIGHWQINSSQAYRVRLWYTALFDQYTLSETATALDLKECHNGNYTIAGDVPAMVLSANYAGGTFVDCKWGRSGTIAAGDYGLSASNSIGLSFTRCHFQGRTFRTSTTGYTAYFNTCYNTTLTDCVTVGASIAFSGSVGVTVTNPQYADSFNTTSSATQAPAGTVQFISGTNTVVMSGFSYYTSVANVHPDVAIVYCTSAKNVKIRSMGTFASPITAGSTNAMLYVVSLGTANFDIEIKRVYFNLVATTFMNSDNSSKNVEITNCKANDTVTKNLVSAALNQIVKNSAIAGIAPASTASIYGSLFYHHFTSNTAGRLGLVFSEPTAEYAAYVTTNFTTSATGTSGFNSSNGLALINSGDYAIFEFPFTIKGIDSLQNSAPTITTATNMTIEFQIDTGSGWNGTWLTFNAANLSGQTVDEVAGFKLKIKCTANATAAANILTVLYCLTSSNATAQAIEYPLDTVSLDISAQVSLSGAEVRIYDYNSTLPNLGTELAGVESHNAVNYIYTGDAGNTIWVQVMKPGYEEYGQALTMPTANGSLSIILKQDLNT